MRICLLSSVHGAQDTRIYHKQARTLAAAGFQTVVIARRDAPAAAACGVRMVELGPASSRWVRMLGTVRIAWLAWRQKAALYALHDPELLPVGVLLKVATRRCVVYDVHEDVAKQIGNKEWLASWARSLLARLYTGVERLCLPFIDGIVIAEESYRPNYPGRRVTAVLNYPLLQHQPHLQSAPRLSGGRPTLVYAGSIRAVRGLFTMLEVVRRLHGAFPDLLFYLVGGIGIAAQEEGARRFIAEHGLGDAVVLTGRVPHDHVADYIARADVGLALLHPQPNFSDSLPTKLFEYMLMGKPVVVSDFPLWRRVVSEAGCGVAVDPLDLEGVERAIAGLLRSPQEAAQMGQMGREAVLQRYRWEHEGEKLVAFYRELLAGGEAT
ncbi:MAG: glycosyltransferase family 4 protein [Candidatus Latescibacterota bacterium]